MQHQQEQEQEHAALIKFLATRSPATLTDLAVLTIPEILTVPAMLFVPCSINGRLTQAMIDTGADVSVIEKTIMEEIGLAPQLDEQWSGSVDGVGSVSMLGRLGAVLLEIGPTAYLHSFVVMEHKEVSVILGLDFLAHHQCTIDLINRQLVLGNGVDVIPFVPRTQP